MDEKDLFHRERRNLLIEQINNVLEGGDIKIYAGEMNCYVYDHSEVDESFRKARDRNVDISILAGPVLSVRDVDKKTRVANWVKDKVVTLYCRKTRFNDEHFRLFRNYKEKDRFEVYAERPHRPLGLGEKIEDIDAEFWFKKGSELFKYYVQDITSCIDIEKEFLLLTPTEIEGVIVLSERKKGKDSFGYLIKEEIEELLKPYLLEVDGGIRRYNQEELKSLIKY